MKVGTMKPGEILQDPKPEVIESPHVSAVLDILKAQLEVLKVLSMPAVYIPNDSKLDFK
jgi:hypothetical protein